MVRGVLHYPRLDTVLMVEAAVKGAGEYPTRAALWKSLPKGVQYQTFQLILEYLRASNKVFVTKQGRIMWVFADSAKAKKLLGESVPYARVEALSRVQPRVRRAAGKVG